VRFFISSLPRLVRPSSTTNTELLAGQERGHAQAQNIKVGPLGSLDPTYAVIKTISLLQYLDSITAFATMKALIPLFILTLAFSASARIPRLFPRQTEQCPVGSCGFTLTVSGGPVYENPTDSHQLAFGGSKPGPAVNFCINQQGQITDNAGTCGITQNTDNDMETSQLQCEQGMGE
jgi:hypothetical protein